MLANQLTRILSYTKDLDIIKKINNKDDYLVTGIIDFFDTCYNDIFPIYDVKEEQRKRLIMLSLMVICQIKVGRICNFYQNLCTGNTVLQKS